MCSVRYYSCTCRVSRLCRVARSGASACSGGAWIDSSLGSDSALTAQVAAGSSAENKNEGCSKTPLNRRSGGHPSSRRLWYVLNTFFYDARDPLSGSVGSDSACKYLSPCSNVALLVRVDAASSVGNSSAGRAERPSNSRSSEHHSSSRVPGGQHTFS